MSINGKFTNTFKEQIKHIKINKGEPFQNYSFSEIWFRQILVQQNGDVS